MSRWPPQCLGAR